MKTVARGDVPLVKLPVMVDRADAAASWAAWIAGPLSLDDVDSPNSRASNQRGPRTGSGLGLVCPIAAAMVGAPVSGFFPNLQTLMPWRHYIC